MPGMLLTASTTVQCAHQGKAQPVVTNPRVKVGGQPTVLQTTLYTVAGCALTGTPNPPCATAQWVSAATRVKSMGVPLLLQDSKATCIPTGTPVKIIPAPVRVRGM